MYTKYYSHDTVPLNNLFFQLSHFFILTTVHAAYFTILYNTGQAMNFPTCICTYYSNIYMGHNGAPPHVCWGPKKSCGRAGEPGRANISPQSVHSSQARRPQGTN